MLFDDSTRTDTGPAYYGEPHYRYLQRTGRPEFAQIRDMLDDWLCHYPAYHRRELLTRLASDDDIHFEAAFFELYVYRLLRHFTSRVRIHPSLRTSSKRPDFQVRLGSLPRILVEAVTVDEVSREARAARKRLHDVYNALNKVRSPDYILRIEDRGTLNSPVPGRLLRQHVQTFLNGLDYDAVRTLSAQRSLSAYPSTRFTHDGCRIDISVIPVSPEHRGDPDHRPVGMMGPGEAYWVDNHTGLREAVRKKARRYGQIRSPLVICVNAVGLRLELRDVMEALFGKEEFVVHWDSDSEKRQPVPQRRPDGALVGPTGPRNTRMSAVLVISSLLPWTVAYRQPALYHNPWARYPVISRFPGLTEYKPVENQLVEAPGLPVANLLGVPRDWPFGALSA